MRHNLLISRAIMVMFAILLMIMGTVVTAQNEPPALQLPVLTDDEPVTRIFENGVYAHLSMFWGEQGDRITLYMNRVGYSTVDPYLILLDTDGALLAVDDDGGTAVGDALIEDFELPETGAYLVLAASANYILLSGNALSAQVQTGQETLEPMEYEMGLSGATPPQTDASGELPPLELNAITLSIGDSTPVEITKETPVAYVTFPAAEGDIVTIRTEPGDTEVDTIIYLFDGAGNGLAFNDDGAAVTLYSEIVDFEAPMEGMYLILAASYQFYRALEEDWNNVGDFILVVE